LKSFLPILAFIALASAFAVEAVPDKEETSRARFFFKDINQFNKKNGFKDSEIDSYVITKQLLNDPEQGFCVELWANNAFLGINKSGLKFSFANFKRSNEKSPKVAEWSKQKVEKIMFEFIGEVLPDVTNQVKAKSFQYGKTSIENPFWECYYYRISLDGHVYETDQFSAFLSEISGVISYRARFYSPAKSFGQSSIGREKALKLSGEERKKLLEHPVIKEGFGEHIVEEQPFSVELRVINANNLGSESRPQKAFRKVYQGNAKLAWVLRYRAQGKPLEEDKTLTLSPMQLDIWIDAQTGEPLGGWY